MTNLLVGLAILVGLFGTIIPILPGALLVAAAILVWAFLTGGTTAWAVVIGALALIAGGQLLKYGSSGIDVGRWWVRGRGL